MRIGYFTNQYPSVSHTFIRREILAMEALGVIVIRYALKPGSVIVDAQDKAELAKTHFILHAGLLEWSRCFLKIAISHPVTLHHVICQSIRMGWRSDRGMLRNLFYVLEATVLADWCRRDAIEHLHVHFGTNPAAVAMFARQLLGAPYSFTAHGSEEFEKAPLLSLDEKLKHAAFAVCVSSFGRSQLMRWSLPAEWPKIKLIRCGVDGAFLELTPQLPSSEPRLVCVGRLDEHKAQIVLVAAARRLYESGMSFEIILVGDGIMRNYVENAIRESGLEERVTITGWVTGERVKSEILAARALVLPSFSENMPVVIMEALALGRPVISTYVAGIPELVQPGRTGWLVPASDELALAEAMKDCLGASIKQLSLMGAVGRALINDQHNVVKEAAKLKTLFEASVGSAQVTSAL